MKNLVYSFWQAVGIALTVPSFVQVITEQGELTDIKILFVGVVFMFVGLVVNAKQNKEESLLVKFSPILVDIGANAFAAGLYLEPSTSKVGFLLAGVLLMELFLAIIYSEELK